MTSLILYLFGKQPWFSFPNLADGAQEPHRERNRLQKPAPFKDVDSCEEVLDIIHSQSYLTFHCNKSNATVVHRDNSEPQPRPGNPPSMKSKQSNNSISFHSYNEMKTEDRRRTRAKTPVYRIGQLEGKIWIDETDFDPARILAQQYQAALPSRGITPVLEVSTQNAHRHGLRRVKRYDSLRDIVESLPENDPASEVTTPESLGNGSPEGVSPSDPEAPQQSVIEHHIEKLHSSRSRFLRGSFESHCNRRHSSDSETLIGSDTETSPSSPALRSIANSNLHTIKMIQDCQISNSQDGLLGSTMSENNIGMQLCMDLLTNDLVTALHRHHPAETGYRVSGLQILLMIEAYEALQQQLREEIFGCHVTDLQAEDVKAVESTLDHWLQALRSIYERSLS